MAAVLWSCSVQSINDVLSGIVYTCSGVSHVLLVPTCFPSWDILSILPGIVSFRNIFGGRVWPLVRTPVLGVPDLFLVEVGFQMIVCMLVPKVIYEIPGVFAFAVAI